MTPHEVLEKYFGFREFLDAQEEVITAITGGADALVVMPTGGGKSLCYQLPALLLEGTTVVVSPLIALMKDQVDALQRRGISATLINSSLTPNEQHERIRALARGEFKLVYIAPERFRSRSFLEALGQSTIALFAVDEAHCLSMWGHDFRPDYFRLDQVLETLGRPQVAAFTATATPEVRRDILTHLGLREPREFVAGFARPNLKLLISQVANEAQKYERLHALIRENKTGIVYCSTRKRVEAVAETLKLAKISSILYHGGMNDEEREQAQNEFMQGRRDIVVATNAFGMGIDRSDIRFVVHFDVPGSVEAYYQEAGRAGRDGEAATCDLLFNHADTRVQEFFIEGSNPPLEFIVQTYEMLRREADDKHELQISIKEMATRLGSEGNDMMLSSSLHVLDREGYIDRFDIPGRRVRGTRLLQPEVRGTSTKARCGEAPGKRAARSREVEVDDRLRVCADLPATSDPALLRRGGSGALRQLRHLPRNRRTRPRTEHRRSTHRAQGAQRRGADVRPRRRRMGAAFWPRQNCPDACRQPLARDYSGAARSAFYLRVIAKRRRGVLEPASA